MIEILCTGMTGFLGRNLLNHKALDHAFFLSRNQVDRYQTILVDSYDFNALKITEKVDILLLLGGVTPRGDGKESVGDYVSNITSLIALLKSFAHPPRRILYASTVSVYGSSENVVDEKTNAKPESIYGISKLLCEKYIEEYSQKNGISSLILRIGNMYGPGEECYHKIIGTFLGQAMHNEPIHIFSNGKELRNLIYVGDVCKVIGKCLYNNMHGIINLVSTQSFNIKEIADVVRKVAESSSEIVIENRLLGRNDNRYDASYFLSVLGENETPLEEGIRREMSAWNQIF